MRYNMKDERPNRSKAEFKALRELAGLSQEDVARSLDVKQLSVVRWESFGYDQIAPADAWKVLDDAIEQQREVVSRLVENAENAADSLDSSGGQTIFLPYYTSAQDSPIEGGAWKRVNADMRASYAVLVELGFTVEWVDGMDERAFHVSG